MRAVVMSSESRDIPLRNLYPNATGFLAFARNDRAVIPGDSEGSLAGRSENRELFCSLNTTLFAIAWVTLLRQARRLPTLRKAIGSGCPTTYRRRSRLHPVR